MNSQNKDAWETFYSEPSEDGRIRRINREKHSGEIEGIEANIEELRAQIAQLADTKVESREALTDIASAAAEQAYPFDAMDTEIHKHEIRRSLPRFDNEIEELRQRKAVLEDKLEEIYKRPL